MQQQWILKSGGQGIEFQEVETGDQKLFFSSGDQIIFFRRLKVEIIIWAPETQEIERSFQEIESLKRPLSIILTFNLKKKL